MIVLRSKILSFVSHIDITQHIQKHNQLSPIFYSIYQSFKTIRIKHIKILQQYLSNISAKCLNIECFVNLNVNVFVAQQPHNILHQHLYVKIT